MATTNIATYISQIESDRNTIRTKLTDLGLATATSKLTDCATAINGIVNRGSVSATVTEGATYSIPAGYHDGSGTVSGVAGGGNYSLQSKSVTPTKAQQAITPDSGYYGLSDVTVKAIPDNYQDVSSVDATAADVLANKKYVTADGTLTAGTMPNNGTVTKTLDTSTTSYTIPKGYHNGSGKVSITTETKTATPTTAAQDITPTSGKVLSKVTVNPIPTNYKDISGVTATADKVLTGSKFVDSEGTVTEGTMANIGSITRVLDTTTYFTTIPAGYHNGGGTVGITLEEKSATPTKSSQTITPTTGKVLKSVTVNPIPAAYQDVSGVTAEAAHVLSGINFVDSTGAVIEGTIPYASETGYAAVLDGMTATSVSIPAGYHADEGTITLSSSIEEALAAI